MKRQKVDGELESKIVIGLVTSKEFLSQALSIIDLELFQAEHLKQVAKWCSQYYKKYREAPNENIEPIYQRWAGKTKASEDVVDAIHDLLEYLSTVYEKQPVQNVPYLLDLTVEYFGIRRISHLKDELEYCIGEGDKNTAEAIVAAFNTVSTVTTLGTNPLNDEMAWEKAFSESQKPLIDWKNQDANYFFGNAFTRDALIGILAPEKRGKTWWCLELAVRTLMTRKRVALFEVGDMSEAQIMRRFGVRLSRLPMYRRDMGEIGIPKDIKRKENLYSVTKKIVQCDGVCDVKTSQRAVEKFLRAYGIGKDDPHFMISTHANSSINVFEIEGVLNRWENHMGFVPDVVIIDYPDILAPEPNTSSMTSRDKINETWKAMRRLSQEKHCLVVAPTQADAASYQQDTINISNFSEDKRKIAHVTGMFALNQTTQERADGIMRLGWLVLREEEINENEFLLVGQCLKLGRAFTCAKLRSRL